VGSRQATTCGARTTLPKIEGRSFSQRHPPIKAGGFSNTCTLRYNRREANSWPEKTCGSLLVLRYRSDRASVPGGWSAGHVYAGFGDVGEQFAQCWREHSAVAHSFGVVGFGLAVVGDVQIDPRENAQAFCVSTMVLSTNHLLIKLGLELAAFYLLTKEKLPAHRGELFFSKKLAAI
jgi:hypothetical protein